MWLDLGCLAVSVSLLGTQRVSERLLLSGRGRAGGSPWGPMVVAPCGTGVTLGRSSRDCVGRMGSAGWGLGAGAARKELRVGGKSPLAVGAAPMKRYS